MSATVMPSPHGRTSAAYGSMPGHCQAQLRSISLLSCCSDRHLYELYNPDFEERSHSFHSSGRRRSHPPVAATGPNIARWVDGFHIGHCPVHPFPLLCAPDLNFLPGRTNGLIQLVYSMTIGYALFLTVTLGSRNQIAGLFLGCALTLAIGCLLETLWRLATDQRFSSVSPLQSRLL